MHRIKRLPKFGENVFRKLYAKLYKIPNTYSIIAMHVMNVNISRNDQLE